MVDEEELIKQLKAFSKDRVIEVVMPRKRRIFVKLNRDGLRETVEFLLKKPKFRHLSTITGLDSNKNIELIYHFAYNGRIILSLKIEVEKEKLMVPTISDIIPVASIYEREVHELFGVNFADNPDLSPLILPENWPSETFPLRKDLPIEYLKELLSRQEVEK